MIGMSQIKKKTIQGIIIGASIGVVGIGLTLWWAISTIKTYENGTNKKFLANFTKQVPVLTRPVTQGEVITDDIVTTANIHVNTVPDNVADSSDVVNKVAKYNISANIPLTQSMVTDEIISADIRSQEVNTVVMPSDLDELDYVDVRIMYPNGTDYIVLAQKQVEKIAGQTMWLNLAEDERLLLNSAIVDSFLHQGTKLYATKYADSESQIKVESAIDETMLEKEESEEGTEGEEGTTEESTNTSNATATEEDYSNFSVKDKVIMIAKGSLRERIKEDLESVRSADDDSLIDYLFNLIIQYKSLATAITRTTENYQPNAQVMAMMMSNGNILDDAKEKLSAEARANIENGINNYKADSGEDYNNVISGAQESITNQKALRTELLTPVETVEEDTSATEEKE